MQVFQNVLEIYIAKKITKIRGETRAPKRGPD